ncbi:hypothetical protein GCM10010840_05530 [Deinococcus aerolatus]|uniref:Uncharacterized protein n=1 Tax=Deinococcus aerolatus TaxID=522487 RepID=A0ABQ2G1M8_9DEIO|nr:hypothetical protein [Deinococcus aerolatus]GGL70354.1 hypothetical protein GCM10010840_05530 [Deinococcus aerolatus]
MTDSSDRYGSKPLGKSVEEVEAGESNRVNSPVPGEQVRHDQQEVAVVPAVTNSNTSTTPGVIAPDALLTDSVAADERRDRAQAGPGAGQTSENSEG